MRNPDGFTRLVSCDRIGLDADIEPLTVHADDELDFRAQISAYAQRFLAPSTTVRVEAHPDAAEGALYADVTGKRATAFGRGPLLGQITVSLPAPPDLLVFLDAKIASLQSRRARVLEEMTGVPF
ncbi:hypothetical protein Q8791_27215 [Nocardiopsis sp. CT-R113]|uniref:Uncharacterized protein n=1 Tax=Nocardiopsis codii TaxID=3065942 RepID=A0ABU7KFA9_9ACTN|nr:hypothetical protein [Nocardiopsis sp. CT-R113]MEE2040916.1 hypothetical protein [Nocardiopsis sp. CT-R113]